MDTTTDYPNSQSGSKSMRKRLLVIVILVPLLLGILIPAWYVQYEKNGIPKPTVNIVHVSSNTDFARYMAEFVLPQVLNTGLKGATPAHVFGFRGCNDLFAYVMANGGTFNPVNEINPVQPKHITVFLIDQHATRLADPDYGVLCATQIARRWNIPNSKIVGLVFTDGGRDSFVKSGYPAIYTGGTSGDLIDDINDLLPQ